MNPIRSALAIIGLACILLYYYTRSFVFLVAAAISFALGLLLMGAFRRSSNAPANNSKETTEN